MRAIRSKNTKPEMVVRSAMHAKGFRFRIHRKILTARPDIVFPKYHAVVFVHGCFWHKHNCPLFKVPKTRTEFWLEKIGGNVRRDLAVRDELLGEGWRVAIIWECALVGRGKIALDVLTNELAIWLVQEQCNQIELFGNFSTVNSG